jgi:hypothetical protein
MEISSVSSGNAAALAASVQSPSRTRTPEQDQSTQQLQQAQQQAQGTTPADERQARAVTEAEKSRPTVNINGQTVGTRVNTTA